MRYQALASMTSALDDVCQAASFKGQLLEFESKSHLQMWGRKAWEFRDKPSAGIISRLTNFILLHGTLCKGVASGGGGPLSVEKWIRFKSTAALDVF